MTVPPDPISSTTDPTSPTAAEPTSPTAAEPTSPTAAAPVWRWLFADPAGVVLAEPVVTFASQDAAEDWLREEFESLADDGVAAVTLMDGEHAVYGPMLLTPEGDGPIAEAQF